MTGIGLIFLILALIAIFGGIYFAAWCLCAVQRNHKEGHYILEEVDDELYHKKLYSGLGNSLDARLEVIWLMLLHASTHLLRFFLVSTLFQFPISH